MTSFVRTRTRSVPVTPKFPARFTDVRVLHTGARCTVFEANESGRPVAVKIPSNPDIAWILEAVGREGEVLRAIGEHPAIVSLRDHFVLADGRPALVFERCAGSMRHLTRQPALRSVLAIGVAVSGALDAMHGAGYLHTDVCPANLYVTASGGSALGGFNEAMSLNSAEVPVLGLHTTTEHTAPELLEGAIPTAATDVYGVAVTLFELLAGHPAFPRYRGEAPAETGLRILRGTRLALPADVPIEVADLLAWALAVDPGCRPPGPAWMAEELRRISAHIAPRPGPGR